MLKRVGLALPATLAWLCLAACNHQNSTQIDFAMGEKVTVGPLTYSVIDASWKSELGEGYKLRSPNQRFFLLLVSVTNGGGSEVSIPLLQLEAPNGQVFPEIANGEGVDQWIGLLRTIGPAQTLLGRLVFDVPLTSYRLRLVDGGEPGFERYAWVQIPLNMNAEAPTFTSPFPGQTVK